jgi:16S rRNA (guanine1207-N2)-methyltransferase
MGVVMAAVYKPDVTMSDINPAAVKYAKKNAEANRVTVKVIESDGFKTIDQIFDTVITNPPVHAGKETVFRLYGEAYSHLENGGSLFTVIQKKHGAESHIKAIKNIYGECLILYKRKGYYILQGKR